MHTKIKPGPHIVCLLRTSEHIDDKDWYGVNEESFDQLLTRYGYDDVKGFKSVFDKTYKAMKRQSDKAIKKKNKHFNVVQKDLIDMLVKRNEFAQLDKNVIRDFSNLLFTANNPDFYRKSVALLEAYDPYEIDEYFKKFNLI